jgi:hypothetical protein
MEPIETFVSQRIHDLHRVADTVHTERGLQAAGQDPSAEAASPVRIASITEPVIKPSAVTPEPDCLGTRRATPSQRPA